MYLFAMQNWGKTHAQAHEYAEVRRNLRYMIQPPPLRPFESSLSILRDMPGSSCMLEMRSHIWCRVLLALIKNAQTSMDDRMHMMCLFQEVGHSLQN